MPTMRRASLVLALTLVLGGCMSDNGANDPLPRMSRAHAEAWAEDWVDSMARTAKSEIISDTLSANFHNCTGKNGETAHDGRFTLMFNARAKVPRAQYAEALKALRSELEAQGFKVVGYQEGPGQERGAYGLQASRPKDKQFVSAGDVGDDLWTLSVDTPCLLPPDAKQQQF
ncbi:hypothetical protein [Streptomyces sp. NBC_00503]|uniref:hypothetical protein n=1 Tax=Streptomyces sp. NBC_00503 TaxID=2903659 RepID=UPI002E806D64|nr:hypothetical protein [Streptomyces sp. NBC_00503]WUD81442.1 hypothetical protein OG490_13320 [Streptomyces sp. NBC_00503]